MVSDRMVAEEKRLVDKNVLTDDKGAKVADLSKYKLGVSVVKKSNGTTLYITRDIAAATLRYDAYNFDKMFYVVSNQQDLHFKQLFKILELSDYEWVERCQHINYGMVQGMSTRKGTVAFLEDILNESQATMLEVMKKNEKKFSEITNPDYVSDVIGITAVIIQDFQAKRNKDYTFDINRMTAFEGNTGPYLQFAYARLCSIERKVEEQMGIKVDLDVSLDGLDSDKALSLLYWVSRYPTVVRRAAEQLEPVVLVVYLFHLSHWISVCHESLWVINQEPAVAKQRLLMYYCARITLGNGMRLLGLTPLERM